MSVRKSDDARFGGDVIRVPVKFDPSDTGGGLFVCDCCKKQHVSREYDHLYGCCGGCAWCQSLEHEPCCHGECETQAARATYTANLIVWPQPARWTL